MVSKELEDLKIANEYLIDAGFHFGIIKIF